MRRRSSLLISTVLSCLILPGPLAAAASAQQIARQIPTPVADHPGNVFLVGQEVSVKVAANLSSKALRWRTLDDTKSIVGQGPFEKDNRNLKIGDLGIGWYRIEFLDKGGEVVGWTTAAVLARLAEPTPQDSPICVDSATAWFANGNAARQERFAELAALAGVNWIRDRLSWGGVHRGPNDFAQNTTYDSAASLQAKHGLKVLQVFHDSPGWAVDKQLDDKGARRFTRDLRLLYKFCKTMAKRYEDRVLAWEPWNEANIDVFGGHTIDEMCSHQKAAYLAFKAGDPKVTVCWNVYAGAGTELHTQGVIENESWPYFETYNIHSYRKPKEYVAQFAPARQAACGRPIWITECGVPLPWQTGGPQYELSQADELKQARFIARSYASSLFAGVDKHFFFILGNYGERKIQFGLLRNDQTPRPGYVALAAVGRFLAGAKCLGRWLTDENPSVHIYAFRARPDGKNRDVLVIWADKPSKSSLPQDVSVDAVYDYLGRSLPKAIPETIDSAPLFVLLAEGKAKKLPLEDPSLLSAFREGSPSPVVLQLQMPQSATNLNNQAHTIELKDEADLHAFAYNFGDKPVTGTISVERAPDRWRVTPERMEVEIEPMGRKHLAIRVSAENSAGKSAEGWIKLRGEFSDAGRPVLAFRLVPK